MSLSSINSKRTHEQVGHPAQRTKISDPCHAVLYETKGLSEELLSHFSFHTRIAYAVTCKSSYDSVKKYYEISVPSLSWNMKIELITSAFKSNLPNTLFLPSLEPKKCWEKELKDQQNENMKLKASEALYYSVYFGKHILTQRLLEIGANPHPPFRLKESIKEVNGKSVPFLLEVLEEEALNDFGILREKYIPIPLEIFVKAKNRQAVELLLNYGAKITSDALIFAIENPDPEVLRLLMQVPTTLNENTATEAFADIISDLVESTPFLENTPFHDILEFLLKQGADIGGYNFCYPIHESCTAGSLELVKYLVSKGADLSETELDANLTPLRCAITYGRVNVVQFLIEQNADVNQRENQDGDLLFTTPLGDACRSGIDPNTPEFANIIEIVKLLLAADADPLLEGASEEFSPMNLAKEKGLTEIVQLFEEHLASKAEGIL